MIEAIIKHIQDAGFNVRVMTGCLLIWKIIDGTRYNKVWSITVEEINGLKDQALLFTMADWQMGIFPLPKTYRDANTKAGEV